METSLHPLFHNLIAYSDDFKNKPNHPIAYGGAEKDLADPHYMLFI